MNSDDVNDRKRKLSNIIKKITETQLLKIREADNSAGNHQDCKFGMNPQERDNVEPIYDTHIHIKREMNKAISIKLLNEKELCHFGAPVGGFNAEVAGSSDEMPAALPKPVGPGVTM